MERLVEIRLLDEVRVAVVVGEAEEEEEEVEEGMGCVGSLRDSSHILLPAG